MLLLKHSRHKIIKNTIFINNKSDFAETFSGIITTNAK